MSISITEAMHDDVTYDPYDYKEEEEEEYTGGDNGDYKHGGDDVMSWLRWQNKALNYIL